VVDVVVVGGAAVVSVVVGPAVVVGAVPGVESEVPAPSQELHAARTSADAKKNK
jgi:hypothetical protein